MSRYIPEGNVDPNTFQSVMDSANAKYLLAKVMDSSIKYHIK